MKETRIQNVTKESLLYRQNSKLNFHCTRTKTFINDRIDTDITYIRLIDSPNYGSNNRIEGSLELIDIKELKELKKMIQELIDFDEAQPAKPEKELGEF